jgi:hypothetical protein
LLLHAFEFHSRRWPRHHGLPRRHVPGSVPRALIFRRFALSSARHRRQQRMAPAAAQVEGRPASLCYTEPAAIVCASFFNRPGA